MQKRSHSLAEICLNTFSGFVIAFITASIVFPLFGFHSTPSQNFWINVIFTVVSLIRSYFWRRLFNWLHSTGRL